REQHARRHVRLTHAAIKEEGMLRRLGSGAAEGRQPQPEFRALLGEAGRMGIAIGVVELECGTHVWWLRTVRVVVCPACRAGTVAAGASSPARQAGPTLRRFYLAKRLNAPCQNDSRPR